jgi:predicted nucleotidyltransferase
VVLFGSYAYKGQKKTSDIDILAVVDDKLPPYGERFGLVEPFVKDMLLKGTPIEILIYTPEDVENNIEANNPLFHTILADHKILLDKDRFFEKNLTLLKDFLKSRPGYWWTVKKGGKLWKTSNIVR